MSHTESIVYTRFCGVVTSVVVLLSVLLSPLTARAFKIDVHIWIAQRILDDARDGTLAITLLDGRRKILVLNERYVAALRDFPNAFLVGSLGPDAFPDVVAGQLVIHPSVPGGWGTADWLKHMLLDSTLSSEELSFALGYLTHASGDVFAHTYVNRYAGDLFELAEHPWAAIRHLAIESFISNYLPPTNNGIVASKLVRPGKHVTFPTSFVLRKLLLDPHAIEQYRKSGLAPHLVGVYDLHQKLTTFTAEGGGLFDLETLALQLVVEAFAGIPLAGEQAEAIQKLHNRVTSELNEIAANVGEIAQEVNSELGKIEGVANDIVEMGMTSAVRLASELAQLNLRFIAETGKVVKLGAEVANIPQKVMGKVCRKLKSWLPLLCHAVEEWNEAFLRVQRALDESRRLLGDLARSLSDVSDKIKAAIHEGFDIIEAQLKLRVQLTNKFLELVASKPFGSEFRRWLEIWRDNIPRALIEYSRANADAVVNSIDPSKPKSSIREPLQRWFKCYALTIVTPIPVQLGDGACMAWDGVDRLKQELDELEAQLADLTPLTKAIYNVKKKLKAKIAELKENFYGVATAELLKQLDAVANMKSLELYKALAQPTAAKDLDDVMSRDESGQGLPIIPDASARILAELNVRNDVLDPDKFSPLYDAIVLAKLTMLDNQGLVSLARDAGLSQTMFGAYLYAEGGDVAQNILFGFVQSIDGNHQWHDLAPPNPRTDGFDEVDFAKRTADVDSRYGYTDNACPRVLGMRLWVDRVAREKLFFKLFKGRIAFGVDVPSKLGRGYSPVLHPSYPDLIRGSDWSEDAIELVRAAEQELSIYDVEIEVYNSSTVEFFVDAKPAGTVRAKSAGVVRHALEVKGHSQPFQLKIVAKSPTGRNNFSLSGFVGCNGTATNGLSNITVAVVRGDSLHHLSSAMVGNGKLWPELFGANRDAISDANLIYPGQIFALPWMPRLTVVKR